MMDSNAVLKKLRQIDDLPTLPSILMEVNEMLRDYDTSMQKLCKTIEKDQALVPKILKLVNSSFYGLTTKISNISRAVSILGFNTVRNAIISIAIMEAFPTKGNGEVYDIKEFWTHSISVAITSKYLAGQTGFHSREEAFISGLLHDIGKVVLAQFFKELFCKVVTSATQDGLTFYDAEKKEIPVTHAMIGDFLAKKWQLPESIADVIRCHHVIRKNVKDYELLKIVHVADVIVNCYKSTPGEADLSAVQPDVEDDMKERLETVNEWYPGLTEDIISACNFFLKE